MAKNVTYRGKKEVNAAEGRIPYDPSVWQAREGGDYINTETGEIREEDQFNFDATTTTTDGESDGVDEDGEFTSSSSDWDDVSQDALGDDFVAPQVKTAVKSSDEDDSGQTASKTKAAGKAKGKKR